MLKARTRELRTVWCLLHEHLGMRWVEPKQLGDGQISEPGGKNREKPGKCNNLRQILTNVAKKQLNTVVTIGITV